MAHEAGKDDTQHPTDHKKFADNFDAIFGKSCRTCFGGQSEQDSLCATCGTGNPNWRPYPEGWNNVGNL